MAVPQQSTPGVSATQDTGTRVKRRRVSGKQCPPRGVRAMCWEGGLDGAEMATDGAAIAFHRRRGELEDGLGWTVALAVEHREKQRLRGRLVHLWETQHRERLAGAAAV